MSGEEKTWVDGTTWRWTDPDGASIRTGAADAFPHRVVYAEIRACGGIRARVAVPAESVPRVAKRLVAGLYQAAGVAAPLFLDPFEITGDRTFFAGGVQVCADAAGAIVLEAPPRVSLSPALARTLASALAAWADVAEANGPEREAVAAVAAEVGAALREAGRVVSSDIVEMAARLALAHAAARRDGKSG